MKRKAILLGAAGVLAGLFIFLSFVAGGPKHVYGLVRYALPQMRQGELRVGDSAPDVKLIVLDGQSSFRLHERIGQRPLVLIFGSYT